MADRIDPYKILQVDSEAEDEVIQAAYRRLARKYHPDLAATDEAAQRMSAINAAWELIGDPAARQAFDRARAAEAASAANPASSPTTGASASASRPSTPPRGSTSKAGPAAAPPQPPPDVVSPDWTPGRSSEGSGYDEFDAQGRGARCRGTAARAPVRDGPQLRALCGLVPR